MWESTLLVERSEKNRDFIFHLLARRNYQVFAQVMKGQDIPYNRDSTRSKPFDEFDSPQGLQEVLKRFPEMFAFILNIESFSTSLQDQGNLFNEYFPRIIVPTLRKIIVTSGLAEEEARERYAPAFVDPRTVYLGKPFVGRDLISRLGR